MQDDNMFGGKNAHSLYVPMSEVEQEVIDRLIKNKDLVILIRGWGSDHKQGPVCHARVDHPQVVSGDKRVRLILPMSFTNPDFPVQVHCFTLDLRTKSSNIRLFKERQPTILNGHPIQVSDGVEFIMKWDISISHLDPKLVKLVKSGATGLTSRVLDKDTGKLTLAGNMNLKESEKAILANIRAGEARARQSTKKGLEDAVKLPNKS